MGWFGRRQKEVCGLCAKTRAEVRHLIAGTSVMICSDCVALAVCVLPLEESESLLRSQIEGIVTNLPPTTPRARSRPLLAAAIALHGDTPAERRRWASHARRLRSFDVARERLEGSSELTDDDRISLGFICYQLRALTAGLHHLEWIDLATATPETGALRLLHRAALRAGLAAGDDGALLAIDAEARQAGLLFTELLEATDARRACYLASIDVTLAEVAMLRGDLKGAEALLRGTPVTWDSVDLVFRHRLLGDVLWAQGRHQDARNSWQAALTLLPPDDDEAIPLRARIDEGLPRSGAIAEPVN